MALYPGAIQKPLDVKYLSGKPMFAHNRVNLHIQAGTGSLFGYFSQPGRASSHFQVRFDGSVEQYVDTDLRAEADLDGNDATISIETEGSGKWTDAQVAAIIALVAWIMDTHGIVKRLASDSKIGDSSKGLSWHRLGIDGNFPELPSRYAGRRQRGGGMYYSKSTGKVCPLDENIDLIHDVIAPAVFGATPVSNPIPAPAPAPAPAPVRQRNVAQSRATQAAVHAATDSFWGDDTERRVNLVRSALNGHFPEGIKATQQVVGTKTDGSWGPNSRASLKATVRELQAAWGTVPDGSWGRNTEAAWVSARAANYKVW